MLKTNDYKTIIYIDKETRIISMENDNYDCDFEVPIPSLIYDLIQFLLVEKVQE